MDIQKIADNVNSKEEFILFVQVLTNDFISNKEDWENPELERFLVAMGRFLTDSTEESLEKIDFTPSWSLFANIMLAATIYE